MIRTLPRPHSSSTRLMNDAVRQHIIAFRLHHHHEVALAFQVEQHFGLALALGAKRVQRIDGTG